MTSNALSILAGSGSANRLSVPASIGIGADNPLFLTSFSEPPKWMTSSARLCRLTVPGFIVVAGRYFFQWWKTLN